MSKKDYIIFSSIDWEVHYQLHHQLTNSLAKNGCRVLFVQNIGVRPVNVGDTSRIIKRLKDWLFSTKGFKKINDKISLLIPLIFPFPFNKFFININTFLIKGSINKWIEKNNFNDPIIITFLPNPIIVKLFENQFKSSLKIYYCANHMSKGSLQASPLENWEIKLFRNVNLIFTISRLTFKRAKFFNSETHNYPPGVQFNEIINNKKILYVNNKKNNIFYIGALSNVIDYELLNYVIKKLPQFNFVFIGPVLVNIDKIKNFKNVKFLGQLDHNTTISYLKSAIIGIIPYKKNEFTDNVYSCKLNEYFACGLPVVSTDLYEIQQFSKENNVINIASDKREFVSEILSINNNYQQINKNTLINVSKKNSWNSRFIEIQKIINSKLNDFENNYNKSSNLFFNYYGKIKKRLSLTLISFVLFFILIFYSPLFWYLGNILNVEHIISKSDAIVVFSGDGYSTYLNTGYQKRALDSKKYLEKGYADKIILSSGRDQTIREVNLLKLFLLNNGIENEQIYIFEEYPASTYENVIMVGNYLKTKKINNIIFITAPYHTRRASLIWNSNFPNIKIKIPSLVDSPKKNIQWQTDLDTIKVIIYEYLAIIHNKLNDRF